MSVPGVIAPLADGLSTSIHDLAGRSSALDAVMKAAAEDLVAIAALIVLVAWGHRDGLRTCLAAVIGAVVALAVGALISAVWAEQRPFVAQHFTPLIAHSADASFPSDHLLALGAVTGAMWPRARLLALFALVASVVVAFARVFVGVHYVGDVAGGFAIGAACGVLVWLALGLLGPRLARLDAELQRAHLRPVVWGGGMTPAPRLTDDS